MSYQRPIRYEPGQTLRNCDVCGMPFLFPREFIQGTDHIYRCTRFCAPKTDSTNDVLLDRERVIAQSRSRLRQRQPPPGAKDLQTKTSFSEEGTLLDFICRLAPNYVEESRGPGTGLVAYSQSHVVDIGHVLFYLCGVAADSGRQEALRERALAKIPEVADFLLLTQTAGTLDGTVIYGTFQSSSGGTLSKNTAVCGHALLKAYQVVGDEKYLNAAIAAGHALRFFQGSAFAATGFTSQDAAGTIPLYTGAFVETYSGGLYSHRFSTDGWFPLWFLADLKAVTGDITLGATTTVGGFYAEGPAAPISEMIADARGFWQVGIADDGTSTPIVGLSASTPRESFLAHPASGGGQWQYQDGNATAGSLITPLKWARSMAAMFAVDGQTPALASLWNYLRSFTDNGTYANTSESPWVIADGLTGTYDAKFGPTFLLKVRDGTTPVQRIASSMYDWRAAATLAGVHSSYAQDTFRTLKLKLGKPRMRDGLTDPQPIVTYVDDLRKITYSGLSFQTKNLVPPASGRNEVAAAAISGNIYRYAPIQSKTFDARVLA